MLLGKANLSIVSMADDASIFSNLHCLHIAQDGTTVACDKFGMVACSPVPEGTFFPIPPEKRVGPGPGGLCLSPDFIRQISRVAPKGGKSGNPFGIVGITGITNHEVKVTVCDRSTEQVVSGSPIQMLYPLWKNVFRNIWEQIKKVLALSPTPRRICFKRKRLLQLLQTLDKASADKSGEGLVFIELAEESNPALFRIENVETGQRIIATLRPVFLRGDDWMVPSTWEKSVLSQAKKKIPVG